MAIQRPNPEQKPETDVDKWVETRGIADVQHKKPVQANVEPEKRYTLIMPESLHQEMKIFCAQRGISLKDFLTQAIINEMKH